MLLRDQRTWADAPREMMKGGPPTQSSPANRTPCRIAAASAKMAALDPIGTARCPLTAFHQLIPRASPVAPAYGRVAAWAPTAVAATKPAPTPTRTPLPMTCDHSTMG